MVLNNTQRELMSQFGLDNPPIFILVILPRSGTNFLYNLLALHPDCLASASVPEDHLVHCADWLEKYANSTALSWRPSGGDQRQKEILFQCLGNGLVSFLNSQVDHKSLSKGRVVTKTPSVQNLHYFFKLFPQAHLLILVRDGRAVVESSVKSFNSNYETMMRHWANAARTILHFKQSCRDSDYKYLIVRYEDLWSSREKELRKILAFLGLDIETYNFEAAESLPISGSSVLRKQSGGVLHWHPVEQTPDFDPLHRWSHWDRALHRRFNWIAGPFLAKFGYEEVQYADHLLRRMWNRVLDIKWHLRDTVRSQIFDRLPQKIRQPMIERVFKKEKMY